MIESPAKVFVIDDDAAMQRVLKLLVTSIGLECETFGRPSGFLGRFAHSGPGCIVADVIMPEMTGIQLISEARQRRIDLPVIILTGHADVEVAVSSFRSGAFDFLEKPFSDSTFLSLVQKAIGESRKTANSSAQQKGIEDRLAVLTRREREVVAELIRGDTNKQVARKLNLSHRTVERHRQNAMKRLGVRSILELGTVSLPPTNEN